MFSTWLKNFKNINSIFNEQFEEEQILKNLISLLVKLTNSNIILVDKNGFLYNKYLIEDFSLIYKNPSTGKIQLEEQVIKQINSLSCLSFNSTLDCLCTSLYLKKDLKTYYSVFLPIIINKNKLATMIAYKKTPFDNELEIIFEHVSPIIALILHYKNTEKINKIDENKNIVKSAISILSYSELDAIIHIFDEIDKDESVIIASKIADKFNISRSVIVNALRKFESAGIFETRSLGVKGTYIKVLNPEFINEINKLKK